MSIIKITSFLLLSMIFAARGDVNTDAMKRYGMCFTPVADRTIYVTDYKLGDKGEFLGVAHVFKGEIEFNSLEIQIPSVTSDERVSVTRVLGIESVMFDIRPVAKTDVSFPVLVSGRHRVSVQAGSVVRIGLALHYMKNFMAIYVQSGSVTVGNKTITSVSKAVFIRVSEILPNGGALAFMEAVKIESNAHAQSLLSGLTAEQFNELRELQRSGARAVIGCAIGAGVIPIYQPPFVPDRPMSLDLSPCGTP